MACGIEHQSTIYCSCPFALRRILAVFFSVFLRKVVDEWEDDRSVHVLWVGLHGSTLRSNGERF